MGGEVEGPIRAIPLLGEFTVRTFWRTLSLLRHPRPFRGSRRYWSERYRGGGTSGPGSYGKLAAHKAEVLNDFVARHAVRSVIEFGCGDGNQLCLAKYPRYTGFDISRRAVARCRAMFRGDSTKQFRLVRCYSGERAELGLSLDVIYHLVEDGVYEQYMRTLFDAAERYVIVYSSDTEDNRGFEGTHIRHRCFSAWVRRHRPAWHLLRRIPNRYPFTGNPRTGSFADFHVFGHTAGGS